MQYSIGIGVLLEGLVFNELRALEMQLAEQISNSDGLVQPPHITVKTPFSVPDLRSVAKVIEIMTEITANTPPFTLELNGFGSFAQSVLYAQVAPNKHLSRLHQQCLTQIESFFPGARGPYEGDNIVFHSSIALGLSEKQIDDALKTLERIGFLAYRRDVVVENVGLFMNLNDQWIVIHEERFRG